MKELKNALLLKQLYQLKHIGYRYTDLSVFKEEESIFALPDDLNALKAQALQCHLCELSKSRHNAVFGEGNPNADILFVGDAPRDSDDMSGAPFRGKSGELLTKMIENVLKIPRSEVYITNLLKCRPANDRTPTPSEAHSCKPYCIKQIELVKPSLVITLGETAYHYLTGDDTALSKVRGILRKYPDYSIIPTYHPSYLLRNPSAKKEVFEDLKLVRQLM